MSWHGYALLVKPSVLSMQDWRTVLLALYRVLDGSSDDLMPSRRLHYRLSSDNMKVIVEACFEAGNLGLDRLAQYLSSALDGKYTPAQCLAGLKDNVEIFRPNEPRMLSGDAARAYLAANKAEWEIEE